MKKSFLLLVFIFITQISLAGVKELILVTPINNPKCIEYYYYKDSLYCSTKVHHLQPTEPSVFRSEPLEIKFDERPWRAAWGQKTDVISTIEYLPMGADINQWNELITSQYMPKANATPMRYAQTILSKLKNMGLDPKFTFHKKAKDEVIFEYRIDHPQNLRQDEIQRVISGKQGIYVLHYVIKKSDMGEASREKWLRNLQMSKIKD